MPTNVKMSWLKLLIEEYKFRFANPFDKSGLFVFSLLVLLSIGFFGPWVSVYDWIFIEGIWGDSANRAFCGSVISLVVVSCLDVLLIHLNKDQETHQKRMPMKDVTYVVSILIIGGFCILLAIGGIIFARNYFGAGCTLLSIAISLCLWIQVNASNPVYFESESDMRPESARPDLPRAVKPNPFRTKL